MWNPLRARRERAARRMAAVLLDGLDGPHFGWDTSRAAGVSPGAMYPVLARWEAAGFLESGWETPAPEGRPARRWYRLTDLGCQNLAALATTS